MKIGVIEPEDFSRCAQKELSLLGAIERFTGSSTSELEQFLFDKEVIFVRLKYFWNRLLLDFAPSLKFVCSPTTGLNHIDKKYCDSRGIRIISLKGEGKFLAKNIKATPEHTFGLLLALLRNYKNAFLSPINNEWDRDKYKGQEIFHKKVGIIGFGRVGRILSNYLLTFGAIVLFYDVDPKITGKSGIIMCKSVDELINKSDVIVLCASYSKENEKFINKRLIELMKDKYFINTSRGELIDEECLIDKISKGHFSGLALDVIANENHKNNLDRFIKLTTTGNFILTSHIAGATFESMHKTEEFIADKLKKTLTISN